MPQLAVFPKAFMDALCVDGMEQLRRSVALLRRKMQQLRPRDLR